MQYNFKRKPIFKLKPAVGFLLLAFSQLSLAEDIQTEAEKPSETIQLEEVTVTGTKRSQKLQEVVQSVTVLEEQDTIGMFNMLDGLKRVPNISFTSGNTLPVIRGLDGNGIAYGGGGAVSGARPRMTHYIDGVPRSYSATPDGLSSFWDIAQTEIYRGSQSTQLGRNAIAGAIVQTSNDPKFKDEYAVQVGVHNEEFTFNTAFMANKKINEQMAIRLTGELAKGENFVDYRLNDPLLESNARGNADDYKFSRIRFKTLLTPDLIPNLSVKFTLDTERNAANNAVDTISLANGDNRELNDAFGGYAYLKTFNQVASLSAIYELNNEWSIDGVLAYQRVTSNFGPPPGAIASIPNYLDFTFNVHEITFEPKLSYQASNSRTNAVIGAYYLKRSRSDLGTPGSAFDLDADDQTRTKSIFADATIQLNKQWDLLVGGRFEKDRQQREFTGFGGFLNFDFDAKTNIFLPKIGATYHIDDNASLSALAYKGYTAGGGGVTFNFPPAEYLFQKETANTAELVARSKWLNGQLVANANLFYTQLKDAQLYGFDPTGFAGTVQNAEKVRTYGLELMLDYMPNKKERAYLSLGLLKTKVSDFGDPLNNVNNGNDLGNSPSATITLGGHKEVYPNLSIGGDINYSGTRYTDYTNIEQDKLPSFVLANLNARYIYKNATVTGYVNNVFDKYVLYAQSKSFGTGQVNPPRTVGVNVKLDF